MPIKNLVCLWDLIVITTFDDAQKHCFELLIQEILANSSIKEICHIIADPPNQRLGSGGSTLFSLQYLLENFGNSIYSKKILIIHSGGSSQRLPSHSIQGKIFSPLPLQGKDPFCSSKIRHMFDLKISMYLPFCEILGPGVFVTCADDIETFYFDKSIIDPKELTNADIVALGHPCDLKTATGHGVFVLPEATIFSSKKVILSDCLEVLQKPSLKLLREKNAVCNTRWSHDEMVYSDSAFWLSERVYRSLLLWFSSNGPLESELDAYAHILPCFGSNIKSMPQNTGFKAKLFPILKDFNFKVLVLNESKFYHLGTMEEYLHHLTVYDRFINELCLIKDTSDVSSPVVNSLNAKWRIMYSHLKSKHLIRLADNIRFIAEFCIIEFPINVTGDTILSNCVIKSCVNLINGPLDHFTIPNGFLFHTAPILIKRTTLYVTVAFEIRADMKRTLTSLSEIIIAGTELRLFLSQEHLNLIVSCLPLSLFSIPLFQPSSSPEESFLRTHSLIEKAEAVSSGIQYQPKLANNHLPFLSMEDILSKKDVETFFNDRKNLFDLIKDAPCFSKI